MAIYPDKKDGKLTGRFRVELQRNTPTGTQRYRKRWDSHKEAEKDEKAVKAAWARGETVVASGGAPGAPEVHLFVDVIDKAKGQLWPGSSTEQSNFAHLQLIATIIGRSTRIDAIDTLKVDAAIQGLAKRGKADATINRHLSHLRTFLAWAKNRKYRTVPLDDIEYAWRKESEGRIRWITPEEEKAMKAWMLHPDQLARHKDYKDVWDLIAIAIETGCRRDELITAELSQITENRLHLWKTKTDKPRTVPMTPATTKKLTSLLKRKAMPTRPILRDRWMKAKKAMGLESDGDFVFHTCRHTCATRMVDAGVNVFVIKEWMGHSVLETTLRYAHVKPQNLEDALARVGDYQLKVGENSSISAIPHLPHPYPTGGAMGQFTPQHA